MKSLMEKIFEFDLVVRDNGPKRHERYYLTKKFSWRGFYHYHFNENGSLDVIIKPTTFYRKNDERSKIAKELLGGALKTTIPAREVMDLVEKRIAFHTERMLKTVIRIINEDSNWHFNVKKSNNTVTVTLRDGIYDNNQICCLESKKAIGVLVALREFRQQMMGHKMGIILQPEKSYKFYHLKRETFFKELLEQVGYKVDLSTWVKLGGK